MLENRVSVMRLTLGRLVLLAAVAALPMAVAFAVENPKPGIKAGAAQVAQKSGGSQPAAAKPAATGASARDKEIERWRRETWQMAIHLDTPNLVPPAVQWAVIDKDPVPGFRTRVKGMQAYYRARRDLDKSEAWKELQRSVQMTVSWDLGFKDVTADQLYLLTSSGAHTVSSNGPDGKKWIVSKVVQIKGKPVCWCLPVEVKTGQEIKVTLSEDNVFDLGSAFDNAMRDAKAAGDGPEVVQRISSRMSIGFSSGGAEHFEEVKRLISQKKYKLVKTFEMPPGKKQYVYRFTCADGFQMNMNFSMPLENVASWEDYLQKSDQQDKQR